MTGPAADLLVPGAHRTVGRLDDAALVEAMLSVEVGWLHGLVEAGAATRSQCEAVAAAADGLSPALDPDQVEAAGNPVKSLVQALRARVADPSAASLVHRGLTSQDVLDTALMLLAHRTLGHVAEDLGSAARTLGGLADRHRRSVMAGRTLTQHAVPVTFGLKAAQWAVGLLDARAAVLAVRGTLPVQCGGAAGTLSKAAEVVEDPDRAAAALARHVGLAWTGLPWHTRRTPVTRLADALVESCDAVGRVAADILLLGRPEVAEVREVPPPGGGGSSTMPHKRNPVRAVLVRSASLQAPGLAATLHACAAAAVDERPDGAWHAEWPTLRRLLQLAGTAAAQTADLVATLEVDVRAMRDRVDRAADALLAERGDGGGDPSSYLGIADRFVTRALARLAEEVEDHG